MPENKFVMMLSGAPDFSDRSFVKEGCECDYCTWPQIPGSGVDEEPRVD